LERSELPEEKRKHGKMNIKVHIRVKRRMGMEKAEIGKIEWRRAGV
jgi:hypothetical protein